MHSLFTSGLDACTIIGIEGNSFDFIVRRTLLKLFRTTSQSILLDKITLISRIWILAYTTQEMQVPQRIFGFWKWCVSFTAIWCASLSLAYTKLLKLTLILIALFCSRAAVYAWYILFTATVTSLTLLSPELQSDVILQLYLQLQLQYIYLYWSNSVLT